MGATTAAIEDAMHRLIDDYRTRCLWFLKPDYYPATDEARLRVLDYIERSGDCAGFVRAATLRQWLLHRSSAESVPS